MSGRRTLRELAAGRLGLLLLVLLAGCQEPPLVGPKASFTRKPPGPRVTLVSATVNALRHVEVTFRVTVDDEPVDISVARALRPSFTLAVLGTDPVTGAAAWESHVLTGEETLAVLPVAGPGTPPAQIRVDARQPGFEEDGNWALSGSGNGQFRYVFSAQLPLGFDLARTLRVGVWLENAEKGSALTTSTLDFAPNGEVQPHELVLDARCADCHGEVRGHAGKRTGTKLCVTCHTWQNADGGSVDPAAPTGATAATDPNPLEFGRLVHRIHRGKNLPTLYRASSSEPAPALPSTTALPLPFLPGRATNPPIAGREFSFVGAHGHERVFGEVVTRTDNGMTPRVVAFGVTFPRDYRDCDACHAGAAGEGAVDGHASRKSCHGCHPDVWFGAGAPPDAGDPVHFAHTGGPQADDSQCASCHVSLTAEPTFRAPIADIHVALVKSPRYSKPIVSIVSVRDFQAGSRPTVVFDVRDRVGPLPLAGSPTPAFETGPQASPGARALSRLAITFGGPAAPDFQMRADGPTLLAPVTEILVPASYVPAGAQLVDEGNGRYSYTFAATVPPGAAGSWLVGIEARRPDTYASPAPPPYDLATQTFRWPYTGEAITESADNPVAWVDASTGTMISGTASPRRQVVDLAKCNRCHLRLTFHGSLRTNLEFCAACHTPERTDWEMRPKDANHVVELARTYDDVEERSVHLKVLVHRIHTGGRAGVAELSAIRPFILYGYGQNPRFRDRGGYPHDLKDCRICHLDGTYNLEAIPTGAAPTVANETASVRHHDTETHEADESRLYPIAAACVGCHANGHAIFHTARYGATTGKEQCGSCHGSKGSYAVEKQHGLPVTE